MSVCCECCVLSVRGLCNERITRPENSYRLWRVVWCGLETSWMRRPGSTGGRCARNKQRDIKSTLSYGIGRGIKETPWRAFPDDESLCILTSSRPPLLF